MATFDRDGLQFHFREGGHGLPFFFQHGLTADVSQPFGLFTPPPGVRMIAFDCRAHGLTRPLSNHKIGIAEFADDLAALMDHLVFDRAVIGGISMGAAISLNFALRYPQRLLGLVISRPAWLEGPLPANVELYSTVAGLITQHGPKQAQQIFKASSLYDRTLRESPAVAATLLATFDLPHIQERVEILDRIPRDRPYAKLSELSGIRVPTLVMANRQDPVHPFSFGQAVAGAIPGAHFCELTAKSVSPDRHKADVQRCIENFLNQSFLESRRR